MKLKATSLESTTVRERGLQKSLTYFQMFIIFNFIYKQAWHIASEILITSGIWSSLKNVDTYYVAHLLKIYFQKLTTLNLQFVPKVFKTRLNLWLF